MTDKDKRTAKRRIVLPKKENQVTMEEVTVVPTLQGLINDAMSIIGSELSQYRSKSKRGVTLDLKEARVVTGYLDALTRSSKEAREQARAEDLADLTDDELLQLASQLAKTAKLPSQSSGSDDQDADNSSDSENSKEKEKS